MTNEQLSASLSYLGDELLAECGARRQRPKRSWRTALIKAACIALVLFSGIYVAGRFDYSLGAGCASSPGTIADGRYYYHVRHSGVWCYDPAMGTSERVLSTFWYDGYAVNGYGIYYLRGETLYVQVHETGERIKLYTAPQDCTRLFFSLLGDGRIDVRLRFNSYTIHQDKVPTDTEPNVPSWSYNDTIVWSEYLLDGRTGELLEVRQEYASSGAGFEQFYENTHLTFGGYEFTLVPSGQRADGVALYRLLRDGEDVTPEGTLFDQGFFVLRGGQYALVECVRGGKLTHNMLCLGADGSVTTLRCPNTRSYVAAADGFVFYDQYEWQLAEQRYVGVGCHAIATGEEWPSPSTARTSRGSSTTTRPTGSISTPARRGAARTRSGGSSLTRTTGPPRWNTLTRWAPHGIETEETAAERGSFPMDAPPLFSHTVRYSFFCASSAPFFSFRSRRMRPTHTSARNAHRAMPAVQPLR